MSFSTIAGGSCSIGEGGSRNWAQDGLKVTRGHHYVDGGGTDFRIIPQITLKSSAAQQNLITGVWKRSKAEAVFVVPIITSMGTVAYNTFRLEQTMHPETTPAVADALRNEAAQLLFMDDLVKLWNIGMTSF